jgi:hypothetical protein
MCGRLYSFLAGKPRGSDACSSSRVSGGRLLENWPLPEIACDDSGAASNTNFTSAVRFRRALRSNKFLNTSGQIASSQGIVGLCSAGFPFSQITSAAEPSTIELVSAEESHESASVNFSFTSIATRHSGKICADDFKHRNPNVDGAR